MLTSLVARSTGALFLLSALATAPYQCAGERDPAYEPEETADDALYRLAEEFRAAGDEPARLRTLRVIVKRYPSSRFAATARYELEAAGQGAPAE